MCNSQTILLLAALLGTICDAPSTCMAVSAATPDQGGPKANGTSESAIEVLERLAYNVQSNLTSVAECIASELIDLPQDTMVNLLHSVQDFLAGFDPIIQTLLDTARSFASSLFGQLNLGGDVGTRGILPTMFDLFRMITSAPLTTLLETFRATRNFAVGNAENAASEGFEILLNFLTTRVLPWLHDALVRLQNSGLLPAGLRTIITDFNAIYSVLALLGYVGPNAY